MRMRRTNLVEMAFGKQLNISMKQLILVALPFENAISAAVSAEDSSLIIFGSFLLYRSERPSFFIRSSITRFS